MKLTGFRINNEETHFTVSGFRGKYGYYRVGKTTDKDEARKVMWKLADLDGGE